MAIGPMGHKIGSAKNDSLWPSVVAALWCGQPGPQGTLDPLDRAVTPFCICGGCLGGELYAVVLPLCMSETGGGFTPRHRVQKHTSQLQFSKVGREWNEGSVLDFLVLWMDPDGMFLARAALLSQGLQSR